MIVSRSPLPTPSQDCGADAIDGGGAARPCIAGDGGRRAVVAPHAGQSGAGDDQDGTIISKRLPQAQAKS
ncbi:hypothetical protein PSA01_14670 [Pseudonocardia saturnea]|uniref:Uncharacterized protein n=1 Tax=Pseudonocardia saturnea TaxID=33909 RepID=A0ABQ0RUT9_9PSEU|nr:hypothetical protein Pdca_25910 [Pseudonocardia autotrophica]GEC24438.1 hypothetical protein PSA01_14670 [Pseudonocardia saturnea]